MELRHLRYFVAVAEALNFTKASARLRVAQPALSRQVQNLEDEIGVDLLRRSPRGVTLTAEGKRPKLKRADESVKKVRALARGEYGELHVGYAPTPTIEILPLAVFCSSRVHSMSCIKRRTRRRQRRRQLSGLSSRRSLLFTCHLRGSLPSTAKRLVKLNDSDQFTDLRLNLRALRRIKLLLRLQDFVVA